MFDSWCEIVMVIYSKKPASGRFFGGDALADYNEFAPGRRGDIRLFA